MALNPPYYKRLNVPQSRLTFEEGLDHKLSSPLREDQEDFSVAIAFPRFRTWVLEGCC